MRLTALLLLLLCPLFAIAEVPLGPASDLNAILDALNARGQELTDFSADVALHTVDDRTGQDTAQLGRVTFQQKKDEGSRIRVAFDTKRIDDGAGKPVTQKLRMDYVLDGGWLTDRDYQRKLEVKRQVLRPGQKMNLLKLGEGPFPLPIGQDKDEVKRQFDASKVDTAKDDPKETVHVKLVPKAGATFAKRFKQIDVYVDTKTNMPVRIDTVERAGTTRSTELTNVKLNDGVRDEAFALPNIDSEGWNRREEPFE